MATRSSKKRKLPPKTTGRSKTVARVKIKVRKRVKIPRFQFFHILETDEQRATIPKDIPNKYMFFGTVVARGRSKNTWNVKWDILPVNQNIVKNITRTKLSVVEDGEEEKAIPDGTHLDDLEYDSDNDDEKSPSKSVKKDSEDTFCKMDASSLKVAETYTMRWGNEKDDVVVWKILQDGEIVSLNEDTLVMPEKVEFNLEMLEGGESELDDPTEVFFKYFFPDITGEQMMLWCFIVFSHLIISITLFFHGLISGHAKIIDKYLSDCRATYHDTVVRDKIVFFDESSQDPDWKVRQCYILLIASATESVSGVENLWKSGPSAGHHTYLDFGQYMPVNYFKAFCSAAPFC